LQGPPLDDETLVPRILKRLDSKEYRDSLREIEQMTVEPYISFREAREKVMKATDVERARLWIKYRIMDPRFDRLVPTMPVLGLKEAEAEIVANYLVERYGTTNITEDLKHGVGWVVPRDPTRSHVVIAFVIGVVTACGVSLFLFLIRKAYRTHVKSG
jgi:hypothetical protein